MIKENEEEIVVIENLAISEQELEDVVIAEETKNASNLAEIELFEHQLEIAEEFATIKEIIENFPEYETGKTVETISEEELESDVPQETNVER